MKRGFSLIELLVAMAVFSIMAALAYGGLNSIARTRGDLAKQEAKTAAGAAGATIGGMIIFGPIGAIGGAFVTGKSVVIPVGATTFVQVANDTTVEGLVQTANKEANIFPETTSTKTTK